MIISSQLYDRPGGALLLDMTGRVQGAHFATDVRGYRNWSGFVPMTSGEAFRWYDFSSGHIVISWGSIVLYQGRVEDPRANGDPAFGPVGLELTAFGYSQAYSDTLYTALWSTQRTDRWEPVTVDQLASRFPERFAMSNDGALRIAPQTGEAFDSTHIGSLTDAIPHNSARQIVTVSFDYDVKVTSSTWTASLSRYTDGYTFQSTVWSVTATGTGSQSLSITACDRLLLNLLFNRARTTLGTTIAAGARTVTPGIMTGIVVGNILHIGNNGGAANSEPEDVEVTAITATTFTAVFQYPHDNDDAVSFVYEGETEVDCYVKISNLRIKTTTSSTVDLSEIAGALVSYVDGINPTQIDNVTSLIQSTSLDQKEALFEDMRPSAILNQLCLKGDSARRRWDWRVYDYQHLWVAPEGYDAQTWYVDEAPPLLRSLQIENEAYATYQDVSGRTKRTAVATDAGSAGAFGIKRRGVVDAQTTSLTEAEQIRDTYIDDHKYNGSLGEFVVKQLRTVDGAIVPGWYCRTGDRIVVRGYPAGSASSIDYIRWFPVFSTDFVYGLPGDRRQLGVLKVVSTRLPVSLPGLLARKG